MPSKKTTVSTLCHNCGNHYERTARAISIGQLVSDSGSLTTGVFSVCPTDNTLNVIPNADGAILRSGETIVSLLVDEGAQDLRGMILGAYGVIASTHSSSIHDTRLGYLAAAS